MAVASSGIASQLLQEARTGHSRFKLPFNLLSTSTCNISLRSDEALLIQKAELILWDECPMMHRHAFEVLDRSLRDIMGQIDSIFKNVPFGNKIIVFGGDFRQILPVVKRRSDNDIIKSSFNRSNLWKYIIQMKLTINMRILSLSGLDQTKAQEFSDFLIRIGEGTEKTYQDEISGFNDLMKLPESIAQKMTEKELKEFTFPGLNKMLIVFYFFLHLSSII